MNTDNKEIKEYQEVLQNRAHIIIGKQGITPKMLDHIRAQFKQHKILKIKIMKEVAHTYGVDYFIEYLMQQLQIYVLDARGFTIIISKRKITGLKIASKYRKMRAELVKKTPSTSSSNSSSTENVTKDAPIVDNSSEDNLDENKITEENPMEEDPLEIDLAIKYGEDPEFINYDDEELLQHINKVSDEIYGGDSTPDPVKPSDTDRTPGSPAKKKKSSTYWPKGSSNRSSQTKGSPSYSKASRPMSKKQKKTSRRKSSYERPSKDSKSRSDAPKKGKSGPKSSGKSRGRWNKDRKY
ncbi:MAG: YhbY family RNA-binding protein [Promethearchaeota archaeon]